METNTTHTLNFKETLEHMHASARVQRPTLALCFAADNLPHWHQSLEEQEFVLSRLRTKREMALIVGTENRPALLHL